MLSRCLLFPLPFVFLFSANGLELSEKNRLWSFLPDLLMYSLGVLSYDTQTSMSPPLKLSHKDRIKAFCLFLGFTCHNSMQWRLLINPQVYALTRFLFSQATSGWGLMIHELARGISGQNTKGVTARWVYWQCASSQDREVRWRVVIIPSMSNTGF